MPGVVVLAVGNAFRRDDGVGRAVVERARPDLPAGVRVVEVDGEPARVVDAWTGFDVAIVADAVRTGAPVGTVHRLDLTDGAPPPAPAPGSSHGLGVEAAVGLGRAVGRVPRRVVVVGVEGADFGDGPGLSPAVAAALDDAAGCLVAEAARPAGAIREAR